MDFLCIHILNSNHVDVLSSKTVRDMLEDETWMQDLLDQWKLEAPMPIPSETLHRIKELRAQMYSILIGTSDNLTAINQVLNRVSARLQFDNRKGEYHLMRVYDTAGWDLVLWHIAKSFADMLCGYDLSRIKVCSNPDCGWIFYDVSKNKSRRWCSDKTCGNVMKVRRFRERQNRKADDYE